MPSKFVHKHVHGSRCVSGHIRRQLIRQGRTRHNIRDYVWQATSVSQTPAVRLLGLITIMCWPRKPTSSLLSTVHSCQQVHVQLHLHWCTSCGEMHRQRHQRKRPIWMDLQCNKQSVHCSMLC